MTGAKIYNPGFYKDMQDSSHSSALRVLSIVFDIFEIRSVVDFGCGPGAWLRAAEELGNVRALGID